MISGKLLMEVNRRYTFQLPIHNISKDFFYYDGYFVLLIFICLKVKKLLIKSSDHFYSTNKFHFNASKNQITGEKFVSLFIFLILLC